MYVLKFLIIVVGFIYIEGIDIKLKYCRFRCSNSCETPPDKSNPIGIAKPPSAYYWRDFYGVIPPDAYPIGSPSQFPQTYIGQVYDPMSNGTFATTIFEGLGYVYTALNGSTRQIQEHIQILCTKSPEELQWLKLTPENYKTFVGYSHVIASYHVEFKPGKPHVYSNRRFLTHFIVKTNKCHITYAGHSSSLTSMLEYALIDGSYDVSDDYLWLMYKKQEPTEDGGTTKPTKSKSFFSHYSEFKIQPNSIIPKFYKQLTIGACTITCTNENEGDNNKIKNDEKLSTSMAYYWKPRSVFDGKEAPTVRKFNQDYYVGQIFIQENYWDVGEAHGSSIVINLGSYSLDLGNNFQVLSTNYPEKVRWVSATPETFEQIDKNKLVPGGAVFNGTETFVCRYAAQGSYFFGSARVVPEGTYCYAQFGPDANYEVITIQQGLIN